MAHAGRHEEPEEFLGIFPRILAMPVLPIELDHVIEVVDRKPRCDEGVGPTVILDDFAAAISELPQIRIVRGQERAGLLRGLERADVYIEAAGAIERHRRRDEVRESADPEE